MTLTRATVTEMVGNKCRITIPSMSTGTQIDASICAQKGQAISYSPGDVVFVALLDSKEWVILGLLYTLDNLGQAGITNTNYLYAKEGQLGKNITLDDSGLKVSDLIRIGRNFTETFTGDIKNV